MKDTTRYLQQRLSVAFNKAKGKLPSPYADKPRSILATEQKIESLSCTIRRWEKRQGVKRKALQVRLDKRYERAQEALLFKPDAEALEAVKRFEMGK